MSEIRYLNFPIQMLEGFLNNSSESLKDILCYCLYVHSQRYNESFMAAFDEEEYIQTQITETELQQRRFRTVANYYNVTLKDPQLTYNRGRQLAAIFSQDSPHCGLNLDIYWNYRNNHKSDFQKVCLLAYLSIKSILGKKNYCKITNTYWLSRMAGLSKTCETKDLPEPLKAFTSEYKLRKIKNELRLNWHLTSYSRQTRGFYVSFTLNLEELAFEAEKKRMNVRLQQLKKDEDAARMSALKRLSSELPAKKN